MNLFENTWLLPGTAYGIEPYFVVGALLAGIILWLIFPSQEKKTRKKIHALSTHALTITPDEFFALRQEKEDNRSLLDSLDFEGIYILHNHSKRKYYVGQGIRVADRVYQHFSGHGNGDVYADYVHGDAFTIYAVALANSGYKDLDKLERDAIKTYKAYEKGYNRTRGNGI